MNPNIENHHHIKSLIDGQKKRSDDRDYHRNRSKNLEERQSTIEKSLMFVATDFHCSKCSEDFKAMAVLEVETDWSNVNQSIAFYRSKHKACGTRSIRLVTDKQKDGFFIKSRAIRLEQGKYHNALLQPFESGYNLLYGKK